MFLIYFSNYLKHIIYLTISHRFFDMAIDIPMVSVLKKKKIMFKKKSRFFFLCVKLTQYSNNKQKWNSGMME